MFYQLPPAGNPISLSANTDLTLPSFLCKQQTRLYSSGTAALASAIKASITAVNNLKDISTAEVILPAYACPDLVSAVIYAGARPVLVDLERERPWLNLSGLANAITKNTAAIVAVNLFGISERWELLHKLVKKNKIVLIEDSAQYFPGSDEKPNWQGDLVVLSFGRGKPVSLLGGGAVISSNAELFELLPGPQTCHVNANARIAFGLKARLYNAMISPYLYWLPQALPFLHLGETRYHTLHDIEAMDKVRSELLATNIDSYQDDIEVTQRCEKISSILAHKDTVVDLPRACGSPLNRRLLRYPLLLDAGLRDKVNQKLTHAGLGPSIMYPASLPKIAGVGGLLDDELHFPNAENFAARILTLPTHSHVTEKNIDDMSVILKEI